MEAQVDGSNSYVPFNFFREGWSQFDEITMQELMCARFLSKQAREMCLYAGAMFREGPSDMHNIRGGQS